jgi:hypothetical protein
MFAQESVMDIQKEKKAIKNLKAFYMEDWNLTEEERDDLDNLVSRIVAVVKTEAQAVPEGFVLVPRAGAQYFSHDFNGDGFKYHDTLDEAKKEAEANLDWYRDQVADGRHVNDMGEFNELSYGLVIGSAEYSIDHVVTQDDIDKGESKYEVGTEILSLYLSEAQDQTND